MEAKSDQGENADHGIADLPSGPLELYRKRASFNWKDMVLFMEGEDIMAFKVGYETATQQPHNNHTTSESGG